MSSTGKNPSLPGEGMLKWLAKQINARQKIYGKKENRTPEELQYLNNRRPWIKLASSVKVKNKYGLEKLNKAGLGGYGAGRNLAKNFVLFNGTSTFKNGLSEGSRSGIGKDNNSAYGIGGTDFGYKPMPTIESVSVSTKGAFGSLKQASVKILAYNKEQFDILELLYLRLGYSIILEFGNNIYVSNNGQIKSIGETLIDTSWFNNNFSSGDVQKNILNAQEEILSLKKRYDGNYEGILGKISNFNWEINKEGVYNITLEIVTYGDLIDGFFINTKKVFPSDGEIGAPLVSSTLGKIVNFFSGLFGGEEEPDPPEIPDIDRKFLKNAKDVTDVNGILYMFYDGMYRGTKNVNRKDLGGGNPWKFYTKNIDKEEFKLSKSSPADIFDIKTKGSKDDSRGEGFTDDKYISLGYYLDILNKFTMGFIEDGGENKMGIEPNADSENGPIQFDNRQDTFFCNTSAYQISGDPTVCLIKNTGAPASVINEGKYRDFKVKKNGILVGDIMNIYLQMNYLAELCYNAAKNKDGKITIKDHISEVLVKVSESLGGLNKLGIKCDENTGKLYIFDEYPLPKRSLLTDYNNPGSNEKIPVEFLVYGFKGDKGSFVRNFSIKSAIDKNLNTMITMGKNATGVTPGYDATGLSNWNQGLEDIVMPSLLVATQNSNNLSDLKAKYKDVVDNLSTLANKLYKNDEKVKLKYVEQTKNVLRETVQLEQSVNAAEAANKESSPQTGFLPISLNLTIDGLAGMKIFQSYTIPTDFLPSQYTKAFNFIIKKYSHEINNDGWTTKLESFSIPAEQEQPLNEPWYKMSAGRLAEIVTEVEQEKADAEFETQQSLFEGRQAVRGGGGGIFGLAGSASGGATSFTPASGNGANVVALPRVKAGMPQIDTLWQKQKPKWLPYDNVWLQQNGKTVSFTSGPQGIRYGRAHGGFDVAVGGSLEAQLIAPIGGTMTVASDPKGFGPHYPLIKATWMGKTIRVFMGHTRAIAPGLENGGVVQAGQFIAYQGTEGRSSGPHLHMDVRYTEGGQQYMVDPYAWLDSLPIPNNAFRTGA